MTSIQWTSDAPLPGHAHLFNVPTGGLAPDGTPTYSGTAPVAWMVFEGEWPPAAKFGVLRSVEVRDVRSQQWPRERIFTFPASASARVSTP